MTMVNKVTDLLYAFDARHGYLSRFLQKPRGDPSFLTAILGLRLIAVFGMLLRFGLNRATYSDSPQIFDLVRVSLVAIFLYLLTLSTLRVAAQRLFLSRVSKLIQIFVDIGVFSWFYFLTRDVQSDLFLLYFFPLLVAVEYFGWATNLLVLAATSLSFTSVLVGITYFFVAYPEGWTWKVFLPRGFFFVTIALVYLFHRRLQTPLELDLDKEREALLLHIENITSSRERGLFKKWLEDYIKNVEQKAELRAKELECKNELLNHQLSAIFEASRDAVNTDEELAIASVMETIGDALDCQAGVLRLLGKNGVGQDSLVFRAGYGYTRGYEQQAKILDLDRKSLVVESFLSKHVRVCKDVQIRNNNEDEGRVHFIDVVRECNLHSMICVPLMFQKDVLGTLTFYRQTVRVFMPDEVNLCQALANYLALMIVNSGLYKETLAQAVERKARLDILQELGAQLPGLDNLDALMQFVVEKTRTRLNAEVSAIFLIENCRLRRRAMAGVENEWLPGESYSIGEGITGKAVVVAADRKHGKLILENHVDESADVVRLHLKEYQSKLMSGRVKHLVAVPLSGQEGPFGVLRAVNKFDKDRELSATGFTRSDVDLLHTIGCMVGIAIENAKLLAEARDRLEELRRLQEVSQIITSSLNLKDLLSKIVSIAGKLASADYVSVVLTRTNSELETSAEDFQNVTPLHLRARPDGVTRKVIATGDPVIVDEVYDDGTHNPILVEAGVKSYAALPFVVKDKVMGVLFFHSLRTCAFRDRIALLSAFTNQAAVAIENARLYEDEMRKAEEAKALLRVGQVVSFTSKPDCILQTVIGEIAKLIEVEQAGIVLFDERGEFGYVAAQYQAVPDDTASKVRIPLQDNHSIETVIVTKEPLSIYDAENDPMTLAIRDVVRLRSIKSILIVPLIVKGQVIGTVGLDATREQRQFTPDEIRLCQLVANQVAMAIENARLFKEAVEQKNRLRDYLSMVSEKLVELTDLQGLYTFIVHSGAELLNAEDCSLYLVNDEEGTIDFVASSYLPAGLFGKRNVPISSGPKVGLTAYAAATGETLSFVGNDFQFHPAWSGEFLEHLQYFATQACDSLLIVPMRTPGGDVIGVLKAENKFGKEAVRGFSKFDAELLTALANQVAVDMERMKKYERVRKEAAHIERERLQGELHEALNVFHAGVMLEAETAQYWLAKGAYDRTQAGLSSLWRVARFTYGELSKILQDLRDPILEKEGLVPALENYTNTVGHDLVELYCNFRDRLDFDTEYALYRIAQGAISNAVRHAGLNNILNGRIWVDLVRGVGNVTLRVSDNGRGFDMNDMKLGYPGAFGLERMMHLASTLGTTLQIDTQIGKGTVISVTVALKGERTNGTKD